ncbi:hypothetical protein L914_00364 [Phytophthora nicotianae]|uniref:PiggyBac transposable element-derived protein domain-containing protein n=1 Tax=Phytophthora nicotianae TaxID=4792 RepID=W2P7N8_PHYNI|nr:hypothetical protein L914_00364 [Phytophthora nicotianae]
MGFQARWRELKKAGWTTKRPTGVSVDFTYLKPGKTKKDVRGVDFFVGEIELMAYLDEVDLAELAAAKSAEAKQSAARPAKTKKQAAKATSKPKAIATITVCSTTVSDEISSAAPKAAASRPEALGDVERLPTSAPPSSPHRTSRKATPEIILGVSLHDTTYAEEDDADDVECENTHRDLPSRRRNLALQFIDVNNESSTSDGASIESGLEGNAPAVGGLDGTVEATQDDPNITPEADDPSVYTQFESDGENDEGDDEMSSVDGDDEADMQLPVPQKCISKVVSDSFLEDMGVQGWSNLVTHTPCDYLMEPYETRSVSEVQADYPNLFTGVSGPIPRALAAAMTPMGAVFYFMQPGLWEEIADESNNYFESKLEERVDGQHAKQVACEKKHPELKRGSKEKIKADLVRAAPITARDLCVFIGLLLARAIAPNKEKLANHWRTTDEGAIPHGCFGRYMARDRFMHISRNLHFSPNDAEAAASDRA